MGLSTIGAGTITAMLWRRFGPVGLRHAVVCAQTPSDIAASEALQAEVATLRATVAALRGGQMPQPPAGIPHWGVPPAAHDDDGTDHTGAIDPFGSFTAFAAGQDPGGAYTSSGAAAGMPAYVTQSALQSPAGGAGPSSAVYAPLSGGAMSPSTQTAQAVLDALNTHSAASGSNPYWHIGFWSAVHTMALSRQIDPSLATLLQFHGYFGVLDPQPQAPRVQEMRDALARLTAVAPALGGMYGAAASAGLHPPNMGQARRWDATLAPDFKRAAPEIFRNVMSAGATSIREWITQNFNGDRASAQWVDLWTLASNVDYAVAGVAGGGDTAIFTLLGTDDQLELAMRRLSSFVYESRTGDRSGAMAMLGTRPPGSRVDIAPSWLVAEVTAHSKAEHQRQERVSSARNVQNRAKADPKGKGGKGGKGGRGKGKGGAGGGAAAIHD